MKRKVEFLYASTDTSGACLVTTPAEVVQDHIIPLITLLAATFENIPDIMLQISRGYGYSMSV